MKKSSVLLENGTPIPQRKKTSKTTEKPKGKANGVSDVPGATHDANEAGRTQRFPTGGHDLDSDFLVVALMALSKGDFSVRLPVTWTGTAGRVADSFNTVAELLEITTDDLSRISRVVGKEGKINERLSYGHVSGAWAERINSVNTLISCLVHPISETARVIGAVAKGDLSQSMTMDLEGRPLEGEF